MKKFNLISYETGKIVKRITAISYDDAINQTQERYGVDDYFIETAEETEKQREFQTRWWNLQTL